MPSNLELRRDRELYSGGKGERYQEKIERFSKIREAFRGQETRADDIDDYWSIYNCQLDGNNYYNGNSDLYVPIVHAGVNAKATRNLNQLFPSSGRYFDVTSSDTEQPSGVTALLEDYVRATELRTAHVSSLIINGEIEGQYNLYVDWNRSSRWVVSRETIAPRMALPGMPAPNGNMLEPGPEPIEGMTIEQIFDQHPTVEVLHDTDVVVRPVSAHSVEDALRQGGDVTIIRRWTRETLEEMLDHKLLRSGPTKELLAISERRDDADWRRGGKELIDAAGVRMGDGGMKVFQVYETWQLEDCGGGEGQRLTKSYYGGYNLLLSCRRNPMWNDRCQLISVPKVKQAGVFKGALPLRAVAPLQYFANQIAQQAADSATYSMMPIVMTDPAKNPRTSTMLLNVGAVWEIDPASTQFAQFPPIWKEGIDLINSLTQQIFQVMGVNPSMLPQQSGVPGRKRNQAEIAMEQQVDILSTAQECSVLEERVLSPMATMWAEFDHQFRDEEATVKAYGPAGYAANMQKVPLLQSTTRYHFLWYGVEQARNAAANQQLIAAINVAMSPAMQGALAKAGKMIDPSTALEESFGRLVGWREARQIIVDQSAKYTIPPEQENEMLIDDFDVGVSIFDDDQKHMQVHGQLLRHPDPRVQAHVRDHMQRHNLQMGMKQMKQAQQMGMGQPQGPQQGPQQGGGGGPTPPVTGGQSAGPRLMRGPAGTIHPDQMARAGAVQMPRKM